MADVNTHSSRLFRAGAFIVTVSGLLSASFEGLAHVTHWISYFGPTTSYIDYYPLTFGVHPNTWVFIICTIGGLLGLSYSIKSNRTVIAFASVLVTSIGLILPLYITRITIPEAHYFEVHWIGSDLILAGLLVMFLSSVTSNCICACSDLIHSIPDVSYFCCN